MPVEFDSPGFRQVIHDERGVAHAQARVLDEWQFALRALARIGRVDDLVGNMRDAQPSLELAAEWAQVRDGEHARKLEKLDGWMQGVRHEPVPFEAVTWAKACSKRPQSPVVSKMVRISSRRAP